MANALDYLSWRGDLDFRVSFVNEVDIFLFSQLSTPDYTGIADSGFVTVAEAAAAYFSTHSEDVSNLGVLQSASVLPMLKKLASCPRYRDVRIGNYVSIINSGNTEQFSALTSVLPDGTMVVSFRGTDDTIIGWKEDFNIALLDEVPAQTDAVHYLNLAASGFCGDIIVCGHSKGGNLAIYAAANANDEVKSRLVKVYSFDGPGFRSSFVSGEDYKSIADRTVTVLSQNSIVGLLLNDVGAERIVKSNVAGPMAHDGFNWEVLGTEFVSCPELSPISKAFNKAADDTILKMPHEELEAFIEEFFDILLSGGADTIAGFTGLKASVKLDIVKALLTAKNTGAFRNEFLEKLVRNLI